MVVSSGRAATTKGSKAMANNLDAFGTRRDQSWRLARWSVIAAILLLPLIAMQFTDQVQWTAFDFLAMGVLLGGAGLLFELVAWKVRKPAHRLLLAAGIVGVVLVIWVEAAVGIFH